MGTLSYDTLGHKRSGQYPRMVREIARGEHVVSGRKGRRAFGHIRRLPSKRWQASYIGPDLARHTAPRTFQAKVDAEAWLISQDRAIGRNEWKPPARSALPAPAPLTVGKYSDAWLVRRELKPRTRTHYRSILDRLILPTFADVALRDVTPRQVAHWHHELGTATPTMRSHAYVLLSTIFGSAVAEEECSSNPCKVRGATTTRRVVEIRPATLDELATIVAAMPPRFRVLTTLTAWCGLRSGEARELRRGDVDLDAGVLRITRAVSWADGKPVVSTPKSRAGIRTVSIPPHVLPSLEDHLRNAVPAAPTALLFPAAPGDDRHLPEATLRLAFITAREGAGRPDLRWHDLRHTSAVLAAATGATLAELMSRMGHASPAVAMRYQHAARGRDAEIATALSALAERT